MNIYTQLRNKILDYIAVIWIIGHGYIGFPLVIRFSKEGFRVLGLDIDDQKA